MALQAGQAYVDLVPRLDPGFGARAGAMIESATRPVIARVSQAFTSFGEDLRRRGARMATFITLPLLAAAGASFKFASDLNESRNKASVIFEAMFKDVSRWASNSARAFGLSRAEAFEASSTFGNMFRQLHIGLEPTTAMSKRMVELAGDFASFHNADISEVLAAQTAAFRGEYDALQRFVPTITAAAVQQRAMADTGKDNVDALTDQEKAIATYKLMLEGAGEAVGDYGRTADGAANKQRTVTALLKDFAAAIGKRLLPIGEKLLGWVQRLLKGWDELGPTGQRIALILAAVAAAAGPVVYVLGAIATAVGAILAGGVWALIAAVVALAVAATAMGVDWGKVWQAVRGAAVDAWDYIKRVVLPIARDVLDTIIEVIRAGVAVVLFLWDNFGSYIVEAIKSAWDFVLGVISAAVEFIQGILDVFIGVFTLDWDTFWNGVKSVVSGVWDFIAAIVGYALDTIVTIVKAGLALVGIAFGAAWDALVAVVRFVWETIKSIVSGAINAVVGFIAALPGRIIAFGLALVGAGLALGKALINGFWEGVKAIANFVGDIADAILDAFKDAWNWVAKKINHFLPNKVSVLGVTLFDLPDNPLPTFHQGGIVKGRPGQEVLTLLKAGERVRTQSQEAALEQTGGTAGDLNVYVNVEGSLLTEAGFYSQIADGVHEALLKIQRHNGDLGFT
ncbi:MAG: hypothetical protein WD598_16390 [Acidimicrobiia bacterium]